MAPSKAKQTVVSKNNKYHPSKKTIETMWRKIYSMEIMIKELKYIVLKQADAQKQDETLKQDERDKAMREQAKKALDADIYQDDTLELCCGIDNCCKDKTCFDCCIELLASV